MAISETHYLLLRELRDKGVLPQGGRILEIGMANFYGDMDILEMYGDSTSPGNGFQQGVLWTLRNKQQAGEQLSGEDAFQLARIIYDIAFAPKEIVSIDLDPDATDSIKADLNAFIFDQWRDAKGGRPDTDQFNVAINHGTAEHIFNIANVFRVMHDATVVGGLMIHESPFTGWVDHGFYCLQPTLFWDVAAANGYEMVMVATEHLASKTAMKIESREQIHEMKRRGQLADNLMLFVVMRKGADAPFKIPMQGVYAGTVSEQVNRSWVELR